MGVAFTAYSPYPPGQAQTFTLAEEREHVEASFTGLVVVVEPCQGRGHGILWVVRTSVHGHGAVVLATTDDLMGKRVEWGSGAGGDNPVNATDVFVEREPWAW